MKMCTKILIIAATLILTTTSTISAYFAFDDVEIKDLAGDKEYNASTNVFLLKVPSRDVLSGITDDAENGDQEEEENKEDTKDLDGDGRIDVIENAVKEVINTSELPTWDASGTYQEINKLLLVNRNNPVGADYVPVDLVRPEYCATNRSADGQYMTREACDAFNKLAYDASQLGYEIVVTTAYRSYNFQSYLYNSYVQRDGQEAADRYSARPGTSEHQSGLAADVSSPSVNYELVQAYGDTSEGIWLAENCYKYGFIIRFPDGDEGITGYMYEPWHIRYVGQDIAREIYALDLTLEEYVEKISNSEL